MKKKFALILTLSIIAVLYSGYYFGIPLIANTQKFEHFIENHIQKQTGFKIDFVNLRMRAGIIPSVIFKAEEINILNDDGTKALVAINPYYNIKLLPVLRKKIVISKSGADYFEANLVYDKEHRFLLGQYPLKSQEKLFVLEKLSVNVDKYLVFLDDELQDKTLKFEGENFKIRKYIRNKFVNFSTNSSFSTGNKLSKLDADVEISLPINKISEDKVLVNINLENLDLSEFTEYVKTLTNGKIKELYGIVNFKSETEVIKGHKNIKSELSLNKLGIMQKDRASSIYSDFPLQIVQDINIINDGVKINSFTIKSDGLDIAANGGIYKTGAKFPELDLKVTANKVTGAALLPLFPGEENLNPDFNFYKLKEHMIYGNATGNIEIKGEANYPNLYGSALATDVYLKEPIKNTPQNGVLKFSFDKHTMYLDAHVFTDMKEYVDVKGSFKLFKERYSDVDVKSTQNIELTKVMQVLMPLRDIFKFELGPLPMMSVDGGYGNANFKISGTRTDSRGWGQINFRDGIASFITVNNMVVKNIGGWLKFDGYDATFKSTSATLNELPVNIDGECTLKGDVSVDVRGDNQNSADLMKIINTSPILKELQNMLAPITFAEGKTKIYLNIFGHVDRGVEPVFNKDLFAKGWVEFISNNMTFFPQKIPASNINGIVNFDKQDGNFKIDANLVNSPISTNGVIKNNILTANAYSHKFNAGDYHYIAKLLYGDLIKPIPGINTISTSFSGHYKGVVDINKFDYSKITAKGKIYNNFGAKSPILVNNSEFDIKNGHLHIAPIRGMFSKNPFNLQIDADKIVTPQQVINGSFSMKNFDISTLNGLNIPEYPQFKNFDNFSGKIDVASKIKNNNIRLFAQLGDTSFVYKPKNIKIKILNGNTLFDTDDLNLNKINAYVGEMPVFLNGKIKNITSGNPDFNLYVNAKPTQEFFDQFINAKSVYPVKLKGDVLVVSKLDGQVSKLNSKTNLKLDENSSLYFMGATIGDLTNSVNINIDSVSGLDWIKLNNFKYDKIITSQNGKKYPNTQLSASGGIQLLKNKNLRFNNFKVKTENPTDAKIFNIIFKKPFMKQGVFMSDMVINGDMLTPKILGTLNVTSIDVPVVDATVKDVDFNFKNDNIYIKAKSSVLDNEIIFNAIMQNKFTVPYTFNNVNVHFDNLDLNVIADAVEKYDAALYKQNLGVDESAKAIDPTQIIIKNGEITADKIKIQNLNATNFDSHFSINKNKLIKLKDYSLKVAEGTVNGYGDYDITKHKLNFNTYVKNFNSQILSESLFNMKGQMAGTLNGDVNIKCTGETQADCLKTLAGSGQFVIADGRMPKLGSLEYLLKATNIVTSGITRISINNIIDLITPLKTGQFKSITGQFKLDKGFVKDIEIFSKGNDLNLYLTGDYDIESYIAKMEVYGTLSSNLTSVFGKLKNFSLNTLLNTIPLLNNTEYSPELTAKIDKIPKDENFSVSRIFAVVIDGDINGMNYVKSFKWVK